MILLMYCTGTLPCNHAVAVGEGGIKRGPKCCEHRVFVASPVCVMPTPSRLADPWCVPESLVDVLILASIQGMILIVSFSWVMFACVPVGDV